MKNKNLQIRIDRRGYQNCGGEMRNHTKIKLKDALENAESYIEEMKTWDDKKLCKYLDLFQKQMQMAYDQGNHEAFELLQEYERQVLRSRMLLNFGD